MFFNEKIFEILALSSNQYGLEKYGVDPFFSKEEMKKYIGLLMLLFWIKQ